MVDIELHTRGAPGEETYVCTVRVPPFAAPPDVIAWGARIFVRQPSDGRYVEGLMWPVREQPPFGTVAPPELAAQRRARAAELARGQEGGTDGSDARDRHP